MPSTTPVTRIQKGIKKPSSRSRTRQNSSERYRTLPREGDRKASRSHQESQEKRSTTGRLQPESQRNATEGNRSQQNETEHVISKSRTRQNSSERYRTLTRRRQKRDKTTVISTVTSEQVCQSEAVACRSRSRKPTEDLQESSTRS